MTRRQMLHRAGRAGLTLAAAQALSPFVLSGCSRGKADTIRVGIMHSLSGTMEISERSLHDVELMAIEEINKAGGVLGKQVEAVVKDPRSDFTTGFPEKAKELLLQDKVVSVFGCWTSASRKSVVPIFEENNGLLFYPVQYEGNECSPNVIYTGAAPNQQIIPAVSWLLKNRGKKFYLLGSNYVFPKEANKIIKAQLKKEGGESLNEEYVDLGEKEFANVIARIREKKPEVIFSTINGDSNVGFYNQLKGAGIKASDMVVCAVSVGEDELRAIDPEAAVGHLAAWNYFQSLPTPKNEEFVKKFKAKYGPDRVTDDPIEAAYFQVYLWKQAVEKAGSTEVDKIRAAVRGQEFDAPEGKVKVDDKNNHTWKPFRLGEIQKDRQFKIIYDTKEWIKPEPYTPLLYPNKGCDVTEGGEIKRS